MALIIDHLRVDHRVTVLQYFTDTIGTAMRAGDSGILRGLAWDQLRMEIRIVIERASRKVALVFPVQATTGPRNGHMREYFEVGKDVTVPRIDPSLHDHAKREMIMLPSESGPASLPMARMSVQTNSAAWNSTAQSTDGPDRLEEVEQEMLAAMDHIGVAASIAEMYAKRMRAFQRAGNEPRAIAAFKLAAHWMRRYAGSATSGGDGAALSYECDRFQESLAHEFGYDPTADGHPKP